MPESVPIVEIMQEYAEKAVNHAENFQVTLDYSEQSLVNVDAILTAMTRDELFHVPSLNADEKENLWLLCKAYGGYIGEVIVRHVGAEWQSNDAPDGNFSVHLYIKNRLTGSPPDKVWKRLTQSEYDTILGYYRGMQHILGLTPFVPAEFK